MSKFSTVFTLTLLLTFAILLTARPEPHPHKSLLAPTQLQGSEAKQAEVQAEAEKESCEGDEECLMRRTLVAHLDYIYTQKQKPQTKKPIP